MHAVDEGYWSVSNILPMHISLSEEAGSCKDNEIAIKRV